MVFNATFNNISVISWRSVLLEEIRENHQSVASHWQTLSHNVVSSTPWHERGSNFDIMEKIGKNIWFFTQNTPIFFKCTLPLTWNPGSAPEHANTWHLTFLAWYRHLNKKWWGQATLLGPNLSSWNVAVMVFVNHDKFCFAHI